MISVISSLRRFLSNVFIKELFVSPSPFIFVPFVHNHRQRYLHLLLISAVRIVNLLDSWKRANMPMVFSLLMNATLIISVSLYLTSLQLQNDRFIQNINQKLVDRVYAGANYFQSCALLLEISIHPIEPPVVWTMFQLNRGLLFRFFFVLTTIVIICCYYKANDTSPNKEVALGNEIGSLF